MHNLETRLSNFSRYHHQILCCQNNLREHCRHASITGCRTRMCGFCHACATNELILLCSSCIFTPKTCCIHQYHRRGDLYKEWCCLCCANVHTLTYMYLNTHLDRLYHGVQAIVNPNPILKSATPDLGAGFSPTHALRITAISSCLVSDRAPSDTSTNDVFANSQHVWYVIAWRSPTCCLRITALNAILTFHFTAQALNKIAPNSPSRAKPSEVEQQIATALYDLETSVPEMKAALRPLQFVSAREVR